MGHIRVLSEVLVKKIAAGEVIERPASAVKELVENSIDAGATQISVSVEAGGLALLRVADDGCGMSAADLRLSVRPHATSKIVDEDDLYRINSLGFRGEALASIGSVSRLRIVSRLHESDEGFEIAVEAEEVKSQRAAGCAAGTTVEVRDLFFNVPARRKFMKRSATEFGHVNTQLSRLSLAHPGIAFELSHDGRRVQRLASTTSRLERISALYSRELGDSLIEFSREDGGLAIEGFIAPPAGARSNANWQFSFVNGRFIRDKFIQHAIREAYRGLVDPRRHPVVFLFLSIDPAAVDVNAHPTKIEVRWHDSQFVHGQALVSLREALRSADLTPILNAGRAWDGGSSVPFDPAHQANVQRQFAEEMKQVSLGSAGRPMIPGHSYRPHSGDVAAASNVWREMFGRSESESVVDADPRSDNSLSPSQPFNLSRGAIQLHNTYLVCETDDGMMIIDQHALHERILYEELKNRITSGRLESQRLLLPETISVTASQMALLESQGDLLGQLGLEISPFGRDSVAVNAFPSILKDTQVAAFVGDLLDALEQAVEETTEVVIHRVLDMMACRAAVKAGDPLTSDEIQSLIQRRDLVDKSSNCPHGRPTTLRLSVRDLERQFRRT